MSPNETPAPECRVWRAVLDDGQTVNVPIERVTNERGTWWREVGGLIHSAEERQAAMFALGPGRRDRIVELRGPDEKTTSEHLDSVRADLLRYAIDIGVAVADRPAR